MIPQLVDGAVDSEIRALINRRLSLKQDLSMHSLNAEVMLRIKQGQVEIEESPVVTDLKFVALRSLFGVVMCGFTETRR